MPDKSKEIISVGNQIKEHRKQEQESYVLKRAVGLSNVLLEGMDKTIWMLNCEIPSQAQNQTNITGTVVNTSIGNQQYVNPENGTVINKNSKFGEIIIKNEKGLQNYSAPGGIMKVEIQNSCFYTPYPHSSEAKDLIFNVREPKPRYYQSLREILSILETTEQEIDRIDEQIEEAEQEDDQQKIDDFLKQKNKSIKERELAEQKAHSFIRKNAELRLQPILDPWQEEVKRSHIFDGSTVAINGGPGTGKTTSLIQRLKFLTDANALEDYCPDMAKGLKDKILDKSTNWVFFSPSELLKLFLKNNMIGEGLSADDKRVMVWKDFKSKIVKEYKLFNSETQNPFLALRGDFVNENILPYKGTALQKICKDYDKFYLAIQNQKLEDLLKIDVDLFVWKNIGASIKNYINRQEKDYTKRGLIRLYFNLNETFESEIKEIEANQKIVIEKNTSKILINLPSDLMEELLLLLEIWKEEKNSVAEQEEIEEEEEEIAHDPEIELFNKIRGLIRKLALQLYDKKIKLSKRDNQLHAVLKQTCVIEDLEDFNKIGQYAFFIKYFAKPIKGVITNLFREIPLAYKKFRKEQYSQRKNKWNYEVLEHILIKEAQRNKRIHPNEQAFLLNFINNLIKDTFKVSKIKAGKLKHPYFEAYLNNSWPVIGVDEATDFHIVDLLALKSFSDHEISAVTYSGDIMQRLTTEGIRSWSELKLFDKKVEEKELIISYRQSPTLLTLAEKIYNKATNSNAEYASFMDQDENEPKPLVFIDEDEYERIEWISKRVLEIYKAYGSSIPSIAIFLKNENQLDAFSRTLGDIDRLADVDIKVKACNNGQVLGDENTIRVFSIDYIKGLEFEAVFFHDIDQLYNASDKDLILKNLYVGLSRASFYLGITAPENVEQLSFLDAYFKKDGDWKINS